MRKRIAIVIGGLDALNMGNGQYRYLVDLLCGIAELNPDHEFFVVGSRPAPPLELEDIFRMRKSTWNYCSVPQAVGPAAFVREHVRLAAILMRRRVHLCHALHTVPLLAPCPIVVTQYDLMYELFEEYASVRRSKRYRLGRWAASHRARRLIAISQQTARDLERLWHVPGKRIETISLGSRLADRLENEESLSPSSSPWRDLENTAVLASPYNLEPRKNLAALLQAFAIVAKTHAKCKLVLYGRAAVSPEREAAFTVLVQKLGISPLLVLTGHLKDDDLAELYRSATIFVFPSLYEGFGLPVLEAMAAGSCVVARNASAMSELVGSAGVCVETASPEQLASAIGRLLLDDAERRRLGTSARLRARQFTVREMAQRTLHLYDRLLSDSNW